VTPEAERRALRTKVRTTLERLGRSGELPVLPSAAAQALQAVQNPSTGIDELCSVITRDVSFAARIVGVANSAAYIRYKAAARVRDAVMVIGARKTADIIVAGCVKKMYGESPAAVALWRHSLAAAVAAEEVARATPGGEPGLAFLPGLFHDVGRFGLLTADPKAYEALEQAVAAADRERVAVEREWLEVDHAHVSATLAAGWGIPRPQCEAIRWHHDPAKAGAGADLAALLNAADRLAYDVGATMGARPPQPAGTERLRLTPDDFVRLADVVRQRFDEYQAALA
jgi:HD-like signal output (HDOD) protein